MVRVWRVPPAEATVVAVVKKIVGVVTMPVVVVAVVNLMVRMNETSLS